MGILDDEFGEPISYREFDPTHLRALADRVRTLASILEAVKESGSHRDKTLDRIEGDVKKIREEVDFLLKAGSQFTDEQCRILEDIVLGRDRNRWLWKRLKLGAIYAMSTITALWTIRELFPALGRLIKGILP